MGRPLPTVVPGLVLAALALACPVAGAQQPRAPRRTIPPSVLVEVGQLENRFDLALATDCDPERCFSRGCTYVDHAVADRPRSSSLPGLGGEAGPSADEAQAWLTQASCSFAHEQMEPQDVQALVRRLQARLTTGWTVVSVGHQALEALPPHLLEPPAPLEDELEAEAEPPPEPEPWTMATAGRELWGTLLDDFYWMIAVVLVTLAGTTLIWAWRRVGRESFEEQALLAELARGGGGEPDAGAPDDAAPAPEADDDATYVARQDAAWRLRLQAMDPDHPDPELQAMVRELLRAGELPLLAKAVLRFPDSLPAAFPTGGDVATAKLELAEFLKTVEVDTLPADADFFRALDRHALSAALASQRDADVVRGLREEFGAAGLVALIDSVPARAGALLFALSPAEAQHEMVRLLRPRRMGEMAEQLLRSNRMDQTETTYLFDVLEAARGDRTMPPAPDSSDVSDRGAAFDATSALSVLLSRIEATPRSRLLGGALERNHGSLPSWYRGLLFPDLLLELSDEARADLLLGVDSESLAAWLSLLEADTSEQLLLGMPESLRASVRASSGFASLARQLALADRGRRDLATGFQAQLARAGLSFEQVIQGLAAGAV
jgi:hypothetical protein